MCLPDASAVGIWIVLGCLTTNIRRFCRPKRFWCPRSQFPGVHFLEDTNRQDCRAQIHRILVASYSTATSFHLTSWGLSNLFPNCCCLWKNSGWGFLISKPPVCVKFMYEPAWNEPIRRRRWLRCSEETASGGTAMLQQTLFIFGTEHFRGLKTFQISVMRCRSQWIEIMCCGRQKVDAKNRSVRTEIKFAALWNKSSRFFWLFLVEFHKI